MAVIATFLVVRLINLCERRQPASTVAALYALASIIALLSHYLVFTVLAGHAIWAALTIRNRRSWLAMICAGTLVAGAFTLWMKTVGADGARVMSIASQYWAEFATHNELSWLKTTTMEHLREGIFIDLVKYLLLQPYQIYDRLFGSLSGTANGVVVPLGCGYSFLVLLFGLTIASAWSARRNRNSRERLRTLMLIITIMGPLGAAYLAWRSGHTLPFIQRYMTFSAPFGAAFLGLSAADLFITANWKRLSRAAILPLEASPLRDGLELSGQS